MRLTKVLAGVLFSSAITYAQVTLQPWVQVYGTVPGSKLGLFVNGHVPSANFPYRASVFQSGNTGVYTLQSQTDTSVQRIFLGENSKTGDLNNDGWTDIVLDKGGGGTYVDTVVVFWGTSTGVDTLTPLVITGENPGDAFKAGCIGDVNNDGLPDLVVEAGGYPYPFGRGKIYIYLAPVVGGSPNGTILGDTVDSGLGINCVVADLNDDGMNDLIIRGWNQRGPIPQRYDYVNVYWSLGVDTLELTLDLQLRGYNLNSRGLAGFDANGDGVDDLLWTNRDSLDWVYVHYGGVGFDSIPNLRLRDPQFAVFGTSIINTGDMNGDGFNDIAVASPFSITSGFVIVYGGGPQIDQYFDAAVGMSGDSEFGRSIASVGDVSGDGLADIIVGAPNYEFGNDKGYWGIFKGDSTIRVTSVGGAHQLPSVIKLYQSYPNPFNPKTTIRYDLNESAYVKLEVFDILGQRVTLLIEKSQMSGTYETILDASGLASGTYFYKLSGITKGNQTYSETKKFTLMK